MKANKGTRVRGGPDGNWRGLVLGSGKHTSTKILWETGALKGKEALVGSETLHALPKGFQ